MGIASLFFFKYRPRPNITAIALRLSTAPGTLFAFSPGLVKNNKKINGIPPIIKHHVTIIKNISYITGNCKMKASRVRKKKTIETPIQINKIPNPRSETSPYPAFKYVKRLN